MINRKPEYRFRVRPSRVVSELAYEEFIEVICSKLHHPLMNWIMFDRMEVRHRVSELDRRITELENRLIFESFDGVETR